MTIDRDEIDRLAAGGHPIRFCNGGPASATGCGKVATVVCTERVPGHAVEFPLQWYACDHLDHQEYGEVWPIVEPIGRWFARILGSQVGSK